MVILPLKLHRNGAVWLLPWHLSPDTSAHPGLAQLGSVCSENLPRKRKFSNCEVSCFAELGLSSCSAPDGPGLALSPPHRSSVAPNVSQERGPKFINYEEQVSSFSDIEQWFHAMLHNKHSEARAAYGLMWLVKIFCVLKLIFCVIFTWQVIIHIMS